MVAVIGFMAEPVLGQQQSKESPSNPRAIARDILTDREWQEIEATVDKGLEFLSRRQRPDGSFQPDPANDPGISGLCIMAFLSRGHLPEQGPFAETLNKSVDFVLKCQQPNGVISKQLHWKHSAYSHGICSLVLSELYGMSRPTDEAKFRRAIENAIVFTSQRHSSPKLHAYDEGSWRYLDRHNNRDGDLSITSWNVMFLRSAKNSGFEVDVRLIDEAVAYIKRLYSPGAKTFYYMFDDPEINGKGFHRGMAGAGVLSLSLAGEHHTELAQNAADFILKKTIVQYDASTNPREFLCYGAFYSSLGMFQMGGSHWREFYPKTAKALIKAQRPDGSWTPKSRESSFGPEYMTALTVMALTPPYQILPIFQR